MQFDESKHPRADDGKFARGNGTGKKAYDSQDKFGNMVRELPQGARDAINKKIEQLEQEQRIKLKGARYGRKGKGRYADKKSVGAVLQNVG